MPYERKWSSDYPGCLIILIDQSYSMDDKFGGSQLGAGTKKSEFVATVVNKVLNEFVLASQSGSVFRERADFAVLGYGGSDVSSALPSPLDKQDFVKVSELMKNILRAETRMKKVMDTETGTLIEEPVQFLVWVDAKAEGGTPMLSALGRVKDLAAQWCAAHMESFPPIVLHVTDAESTEGDPVAAASELLPLGTNDGSLLMFNCHITDKSATPIEFPDNDAVLPSNEPQAKMLFSITSEVPQETRQAFEKATGTKLTPGTRGYIYNGDADSVRKMLEFGSTAPLPAGNVPAAGPEADDVPAASPGVGELQASDPQASDR